jgi:voltage-gated potassium channel
MREQMVPSVTRSHFFYLLVSLFLMLMLQPFFREAVIGRIVASACFSAVLLSAVYALSEDRRVFILALAIAVPVLAGRWLNVFLESTYLGVMVHGGAVLFLGFTACIVLSYVLKDEEVTADKIYGAICVYLLIGVMCGFLFSVIEDVWPGSFQMARTVGPEPGEKLMLFTYYSFITLSTVGYGDVVPVSPVARSFSFVEAVMGQIYLATLIARLVGLHIAHSLKKESRK